jgi:hypothetical protein
VSHNARVCLCAVEGGDAGAASARYEFNGPDGARYGGGGSFNESLRGTVDSLVFFDFQLLSAIAPRVLVKQFGDDLSDVQTHIGCIEIVRDGVLEVVTFATPLSVRNAAKNEQVRGVACVRVSCACSPTCACMCGTVRAPYACVRCE